MAIRGDDHFKFRAKVATRIDVRTERGKYEFKTGSWNRENIVFPVNWNLVIDR